MTSAGNAGLFLFLMPRTPADEGRNRHRLVRLKDKLGSRLMASGEVMMEGAVGKAVREPKAAMLRAVNSRRLNGREKTDGRDPA
jgi:acyl-CoA dehydrogenase